MSPWATNLRGGALNGLRGGERDTAVTAFRILKPFVANASKLRGGGERERKRGEREKEQRR